MGNVVSSQESRHQVGDGASLPTVRPEQESAQASFPAEVRALGQQGPLVHCTQGPTGLGRVPLVQELLQGRQSPMAESTQLTQGTLETTAPLPQPITENQIQ